LLRDKKQSRSVWHVALDESLEKWRDKMHRMAAFSMLAGQPWPRRSVIARN